MAESRNAATALDRSVLSDQWFPWHHCLSASCSVSRCRVDILDSASRPSERGSTGVAAPPCWSVSVVLLLGVDDDAATTQPPLKPASVAPDEFEPRGFAIAALDLMELSLDRDSGEPERVTRALPPSYSGYAGPRGVPPWRFVVPSASFRAYWHLVVMDRRFELN